ncbi:enediyne antibiotic chromoprotein [Sphaerisporangium sp. NPDC051017]|uniref:enediyne antibiotic chromoprotein n=1 Tax=unclassified Sphaerisporangium TaxID=2630420 RepID=UPI0033E31F0A
MQKKTGLIAKLGVATAVVAGGLTLAAQPSAFAAAAPSFSVTPSTGLSDGSTVTVAISGAGASEQFGVVQCATVNDQLACNQATAKTVTADASGSISSPFTVRKSFQGVTPEGAAVGAVNCATTACYVSAGNQTVFVGSKQISFV